MFSGLSKGQSHPHNSISQLWGPSWGFLGLCAAPAQARSWFPRKLRANLFQEHILSPQPPCDLFKLGSGALLQPGAFGGHLGKCAWDQTQRVGGQRAGST